MRRSADLILVFALTAVSMRVLLQDTIDPLIRLIVGLALVLVLPGYGVIAAVLPAGLTAWEMLLFSLGTSAAVAALGGIALNWTLGGLEQGAWVAYLGSIGLIGSVIGIMRRWRTGIGPNLSLHSPIGTWQGLLFVVAGLIAATAIAVASNGATRPLGPGFTQLWMVPADAAGPDAVQLGIYNLESVEMTYQIDLKQDGQTLRQWTSISLASGERWEIVVAVPRPMTDDGRLVASLLRLDQPETEYRQVVIWRSNKSAE
ncbi:MAG: DUF1616 domain-containing protein [Chloroflexota bacterium]|nr:MAG: DUF1616 domain-containing protein [Chloroflexota bacterium]